MPACRFIPATTRSDDGFSIIELLMVVVVFASIAAAALPAMGAGDPIAQNVNQVQQAAAVEMRESDWVCTQPVDSDPDCR